MSTYYPDGIPLTKQQIKEDFEAANPGKTVTMPVTVLPTFYSPNTIHPFEEGETEMPADVKITVYDIDSELKFGKYKPKSPTEDILTIEEVIQKDPGYLVWCHENVAWFALTEDLYLDACGLARKAPISALKKKATASRDGQPSQSELNGFDKPSPDYSWDDDDKPF